MNIQKMEAEDLRQQIFIRLWKIMPDSRMLMLANSDRDSSRL